MISLNEKIKSEDMDFTNFLADPAISGIVLREDTGGGSEVDPHLPAEEFNVSNRGKLLLLNGRLDQANYDIVQSKITEYKEAVLNDVSNETSKAKKFRAKNDSDSLIDLVPDVPTKQAFQKLKEYIDLISGV